MNRLPHAARTVALLIVVAGSYLGALHLMGQRPQIPMLVALLILAVGGEALWALVRWLSPLRGIFGTPEQELSLVRVMERELSRSLRHHAPLVIVVIVGRWRLSRRAVIAHLRISDIVLRGRGQHLLILMTETQLAQAQMVLERMVLQLPIHAVAMTNEEAVRAGTTTGSFGGRYLAHEIAAYGPSLALMRGLRLGLFRARARTRSGQPASIYVLGPQELVLANATTTARPLADLTDRVA